MGNGVVDGLGSGLGRGVVGVGLCLSVSWSVDSCVSVEVRVVGLDGRVEMLGSHVEKLGEKACVASDYSVVYVVVGLFSIVVEPV